MHVPSHKCKSKLSDTIRSDDIKCIAILQHRSSYRVMSQS